MNVAYSCVVDANAKFEWQALLWAHSIVGNGVAEASALRIHCLPGVTEHFRSVVSALGIELVDIEPFTGHRYCNKIQQCFSGAFAGMDRVVLTDCDLFFLRRPSLHAGTPFAANVVNLPNPPLSVLEAIYHEAGVTPSQIVAVEAALDARETTFASNVNGGFYSIDAASLEHLGSAWKRYALWLIERIDLLGERFGMHVDQVAMALALDDLRIPVTPLGAGANFHVHLPPERLRVLDARHIDVLHYHGNMLASGQVAPTSVPAVDAAISQANTQIDSIIRRDFDNALFWNWRYAAFPELGSGIGSRGDILEAKRRLLQIATAPFENKTVLDVGCGDLETTKTLPLKHYRGLDVSANALDIAKVKRPDWQFAVGSLPADGSVCADLVICLDVLIHQKSREEYDRLIQALIASTRERLIVSGFDAPPAVASNITGYHEPLGTTLVNSGVFSEVLKIGTYRDLGLFVADKRPVGGARHDNDVTAEVFGAMVPLVKRKDLLLAAMDVSRDKLGFFTKTSIRMVEYPWMYEKLQTIHAGAHVLDIGAGVSPLPIMLADLGARVDCVDAHPRIMRFERRHEWNEWGFLDYSPLHAGIRSFHADVMTYQPDEPYDVIYSLSVIEHMPRPVWEGTLDRAAVWLRPGGTLLLTLDLVPGTQNLWNRSEGAVVDPEATHGTVDDIARRIGAGGLAIQEGFIMQNIPHSRTDVVFIVAKKP